MFDTILGQNKAKEQLQRVLNFRVPQALVFHGPSGVGRSKMALEFALKLNKEVRQNRALLESGDHPAIRLIRPEDGYTASELKSRKNVPTWRIQHVRELLGSLDRPCLEGRQVLILDDFDQMAQNKAQICDAFLKVLEDPGPYVIILIVKDWDFLPHTLQARVFDVLFTPLSLADLSLLVHEFKERDHWELYCSWSQGSIDNLKTLFELEARQDFSVYDLRQRALKLVSNLDKTPSGTLARFIRMIPDDYLPLFSQFIREFLCDMTLLYEESNVALYHDDFLDTWKDLILRFGPSLLELSQVMRDFAEVEQIKSIHYRHQLLSHVIKMSVMIRTNRTRS